MTDIYRRIEVGTENIVICKGGVARQPFFYVLFHSIVSSYARVCFIVAHIMYTL